MNNNAAAIPLSINFDTPAAELLAIRQCAKYVRGRITDINAAEAWISCGEHLDRLKRGLLKNTPRGDNEHIGWLQAFQLEPSEFPFGHRHADRLIAIHKVFSGHTMSTKKLPASCATLHLLATKFKPEQIEQHIADGSISPGTTEAEVTALARKLKLIKPKPKKDKDDPLKRAPKRDRIAAVWELMARLGLRIEDLTDA